MDLTGKTVLITGSSRGIGAAIALAFAQKGANIALNSRHALAPAQVAAIQAYGVDCVGTVGDVTQDAAQIIDQVLAHFGHLDVLVNNAGITADKLLIRMQPADFAQTIQTNLVGTFNMIQHSLKPLFKQRSGCIINLASVVALTGNIGQANYAASKAGIIGLTKSVAREAALRQVRCNALAPGMITTAMTKDLSTKVKTQIETEIPLKRFGTPEEVAQAAIFLAENDYMTGQTIAIDGGMTMY
jgi:3-oxoacyl-[acyl-carrier protein] reductase